MEKYCKHCGKLLPARKREYCNGNCKQAYHDSHPKIVKCRVCGKNFEKDGKFRNCPNCRKKKKTKTETETETNSFDEYIRAWRAAQKKGEWLSYGKWSAGIYVSGRSEGGVE